jgi:hypothetical protein
MIGTIFSAFFMLFATVITIGIGYVFNKTHFRDLETIERAFG